MRKVVSPLSCLIPTDMTYKQRFFRLYDQQSAGETITRSRSTAQLAVEALLIQNCRTEDHE